VLDQGRGADGAEAVGDLEGTAAVEVGDGARRGQDRLRPGAGAGELAAHLAHRRVLAQEGLTEDQGQEHVEGPLGVGAHQGRRLAQLDRLAAGGDVAER